MSGYSFGQKLSSKWKHTFRVKLHFFFFYNRAVHEIMWKTTVESGRPQMTIWRIRIACWKPYATNTHWTTCGLIFMVFSTVTTVAQTHLSVTSYVHWLSCSSYVGVWCVGVWCVSEHALPWLCCHLLYTVKYKHRILSLFKRLVKLFLRLRYYWAVSKSPLKCS